MDFLEVGKIINTHGLRGEVKIATWTDAPEDFEELEYVVAVQRGKETRLDIENVKNFTDGKEILKVVVVPKKLVNIVVK